MKELNIEKIGYRRINEIIIAVNNDMDVETLGLKNDDEKAYYEHLMDEKAKALKEYPDVPCVFELVEYDYDDAGLDIYND